MYRPFVEFSSNKIRVFEGTEIFKKTIIKKGKKF